MLEIKNLVKTYRPKKGVPVTALNGVSLSFPDRGMVFLLGKSGCGKSTLLNVLGGLDSFDSGEFLIAGVPAKGFRSAKIDSYRNTMVGFIFQEYNVLEEFTVGANIGLALQLQGKKPDGETIEGILHKVGLQGYANRRPNELSGGQKQRVAIARALVKDPKIIMADEPTGALDSVTGKQVLDTLKELSRDKLVIVVSHDREFALKYADRIIELSDGKVISDEEYESGEGENSAVFLEDDKVFVPAGYELTEKDLAQINEYLRQMEKGGSLAFISGVKRISRKTIEVFDRVYEPLQLIRSRLPLKAAFPIGAGALKHKKIRLAFTIFLSFIAFGLFGLTDTLGAYDHITTCVKSMMDSNVSYACVARAVKRQTEFEDYYVTSGKISPEELKAIQEESGIAMAGVYMPYREDLRFSQYFDDDAKFSETEFHIHANSFTGFAEINEDSLEKIGITLAAGRLPDGTKNEIVISSYVCESFYIGGFAAEGEEKTYDKITKPEDMLGRVLTLSQKDYTVVGVFKSDIDLDRYQDLTERNDDDSTAQMILDYALFSELNSIQNYSLAQVALVGEGCLSGMIAEESKFLPVENGYIDASFESKDPNGESYYMGIYCGLIGDVKHAEGYPIAWVDGEKEALGENEIIVNFYDLMYHVNSEYDPETAYDPMTGELDFHRFTETEKAAFLAEAGKLGPFTLNMYSETDGEHRTVENVRIVGILLPKEGAEADNVREVVLLNKDLISKVVADNGGIYNFAVGNMPEGETEIRRLCEYTNREDTPVRFELQNSVTFELNGIHEILDILGQVFFYVGIGFAVFAALMLSNFIGTSISYRRQEIGILRAIGARSSDVFRIFFCESFVIAMINFVLATAFSFAGATLINYFIRSETALLVTPLTFSMRQVLLIFAVSMLVAFLASFLPVRKIAAKKPVDAIRGK